MCRQPEVDLLRGPLAIYIQDSLEQDSGQILCAIVQVSKPHFCRL